jgi:hypothetical protein
MSKKPYNASEKFSQPVEFITLVSSVSDMEEEPILSDVATRILLEIVNDDEHPENDTPVEADARRRYRADVERIKANGDIVETEFEW